ncbi:hypothetical protein MJO29_005802 [Puccinia striiformis f. sp. tritici]|nr:hypothetical protein MJO29_005802 [Puccinia striiformis f. sp. tritici]
MSESDIAVAASKALQQISSSAKQRAKSKTSTTSNKKDEILDIFMSPDKPKSRLRLLAQNSAKKYNTSSSSSPVEVKQEDQEQFVLDLGIPRNKKLTTNDYIKPPSRPRKSFSSSNNPPPRSSTLNRRQSSPTKSPKPTIDILLDDLDLDTIQKQNNNHNNNPFQMNSSTKKEESDQSSDSFDVKVLLEPKTEPTAEEEENPTTRNRVGSKPKRVIADSDGDTPSVSTKSPKSTLHPKLLPTTTTTPAPRRSRRKSSVRASHSKRRSHSASSSSSASIINIDDHTQSDDSIEIHPSRAIRFQKLRSQALKKGTHSTTCRPNNRDSTSDDDSEIQIQSKDNRNKSSPPKPVPSPQREVKEIDTTKKTKSKVTDTPKIKSIKVADKETDTQKTKSIKVTDKETKSKPKTGKGTDTEPTKKVRASTKKPPKEIDTSFPKIREKLAQDLLIELNAKVFKNQLPSSIELIWSKRLNSTAGRAHLMSVKDPNTGAKGYKIKVELALKVVDNLYKLRTTLAHELCHVACWVIDHQLKENHGRFFKAWGHRVHSVMKDITITTKHNYDIDYKFKWMCCKDDCDRQFGRHSDSIKPARQRCICGGSLRAILRNGKPVLKPDPIIVPTTPPGNGSGDSDIEVLIDLEPLETDSEGEGDQHPSNANVYLSDLEDLDPSDFKICTEIPNLIDLDPAPPPPPPPHILDGPAYDVIPIDKVDLLNQFDALHLSISSSSD